MKDLDNTISERRKQTRSRIYNYLYNSEKPQSKQSIAQALNLSLPTVYQDLSELMDAGLIEPAGTAQSSGGRPATTLQIAKDARCAIGIGITWYRLRFAAADLQRNEIAFKDVHHNYKVDDPEYNDFVLQQLEQFIDENHLIRERILGVGVTLAGVILSQSSTVFYAPTMYTKNISLQSLISALPYPAYAENDANSGGFAELYSTKDTKSIAFISFADGVGGAVLYNGDQYLGQNYRSGEFGHMCVEWNGRPCACGKKGCLEAYCSAQRLSKDLGVSLEEFFHYLSEGKEEYVAVWEDFKRHLVIGIHNIRMALDCDIVMGGLLTEFLEPYLPEIRSMLIEADPFDDSCDYLRLSRYSKDSAMLGVALTFIKAFLDSI